MNRDAVYSLNRLANPNLAFDGSQFKDWDLALDGPIKNLTYKVYRDDRLARDRNDPRGHPDLSELTPVDEGSLSAGYIDVGLSKFDEFFGMSFDGRFEITAAGEYRLDVTADDKALVFIDGKRIGRSENQETEAKVNLQAGSHLVHVEYVDYGGATRLEMDMTDAAGKIRLLSGENKEAGWRRGNGGYPVTNRKSASIFREIEIPQQFDSAKSRVHMIDGQVIYGRLTVAEGGAYVVDQDGTRRNVDLEKVDRIASPDVKLAVTTNMAELVYADGAVVRGQVEQANSDQVVLRTAFSDTPVNCTLAGASSLRFGPPASEAEPPSEDLDQFFSASGRLRGQLSFDMPESPFIKRRKIDSTHVKAIEFTPLMSGDSEEESSSEIDDLLKEILGPEQKTSLGIDPVKLDRALTVPRFSRDNPPSHILVAKTGDLKRGSLLGISGQTIQFESKLRKLIVPVNRMARVVNVSKPEEELDEPAPVAADSVRTVRATLADGSILVFEALESSDGKLVGCSSIYGEMAIPIKSIWHLNFGDFEKEKFKSLFEEWVVRPAREPEFSKPSPPINHLLNSEGPTASSPIAVPPMRNQALDFVNSVAVDTPVERSRATIPLINQRAPDLGKVRIDPSDRSLRFPVSINQRTGPVEYAVVTNEGKTHESVFRTDAEPTHIHLGLLLLGATPAYARELPTDPSQKLPGEPVLIEIAWTEGGVELIKPLGAFIVTTNNAATLSPGPWVYNGSVLTGSRLAAQMGGSIVSLWLDPRALINNPRPGRENDELHHANPQAFPADPTQLQMVVRLAKERQLPANRDESKNPKRVSKEERHSSQVE